MHTGRVQLVEHVGSDGAVVAEALDAEQASVGGEADLLQILKVSQPAADAEVVRVVDDRLRAQRTPLLVVLLDARVLVVDVQRRGDPAGDDAGAIPRGGASGDAPVEDQLHVVGAAHVEVLAQHLVEEDPPLRRSVEHLGPSELRLQNRDVVPDALFPVGGLEGVRQPSQPFAQQLVDLLRRQPVGQPLHRLGVRAAQDAVVERLERDAPLRQLPLQILVPVDAQLGVVREIAVNGRSERKLNAILNMYKQTLVSQESRHRFP